MKIIDLFQGISTMFYQDPEIVIFRIVLIFVGFLLVYLGNKGTLEPLIMIPMGLGMSAVNAGVLFMDNGQMGNLIIDPSP
jgi:oxaloacetate decarboxylase beta subunit